MNLLTKALRFIVDTRPHSYPTDKQVLMEMLNRAAIPFVDRGMLIMIYNRRPISTLFYFNENEGLTLIQP